MKYQFLALLTASTLISGCAIPNLVGQRGNKTNSAYSLQDQRTARSQIKVEKIVPANATNLGEFSVERCHQYAQDEAPTDAVMLDDLVLAAYAQGADGLANPKFERESALFKNCWFLVRGTATFFKLPAQR